MLRSSFEAAILLFTLLDDLFLRQLNLCHPEVHEILYDLPGVVRASSWDRANPRRNRGFAVPLR